jgi:acetylserotonin N-methyltransferase
VVQYEMPAATDRPLWDIWMSVHALPSVRVADELGVFTSLDTTPSGVVELSERTGLDRRALTALLRMLAAMKLLDLHEGRFFLTETARTYLLRTSPFYWGPIIAAYSAADQQEVLRSALLGEGRSGTLEPDGRPRAGGSGRHADAWASGAISSEQARRVAAIMHSHSLPGAIALAAAPDFSGVCRLLDVGGGSGCFSIALAQAFPDLHCTVMELPTMCAIARGYIDAAGAGMRVDTRAVDMFRDPWPAGHDAMLFANIFHDWSFATGAFLANRAYSHLPQRGRIFVHEMLLDDDAVGPLPAVSFSMLMLRTQGQQFRFAELKELLEGAGFSNVQSRPSYGYYSLITAEKT